jgi:cytochrome c553
MSTVRGALMKWSSIAVAVAAAVAVVSFAANAQSIEEKAQACAACHGDNGVPVEQSSPVPVIWGQSLGYIFFELRDFKSGARKDPQMSAVAEMLEPDDLMPLARYFSKKAWPDLQQKPAPAAIAADAQRVNASVFCTACHQQGFTGDSTQPRLAGQVRAYLEKTMTDCRTGARDSNPGMTSFMKGFSEQDIAAMATYLAGL